MSKTVSHKGVPLEIDRAATEHMTEHMRGFVPADSLAIFTVAGPPVGKQRARVFRDKQGKTRAVTPLKTRQYEQAIANLARIHIGKDWPLDRRYKLQVRFTGGRTDADNVLKAVSDALEGIAYNNDRQVDSAQAERSDPKLKLSPRTTIRIEVLP